MDTQTFIAKHHNALVFFREFVFSSTRFSPPGSPEVEFADAVVELGDTLMIFQMKERRPGDAGSADAERRWFQDKVVAKGTKQVRDTIKYLTSGIEILVPNEHGDKFNLAARRYSEIIKVVLYDPSANFPPDCAVPRGHLSKTAGFIHVMNAHDYFGMTRVFRVPQEIIEYFRFREHMLTRYPSECAAVTERALAGHFIEGEAEAAPSAATADAIDRIQDPESDWNLGGMLHRFRERIYAGDPSNELYYGILRELSKLPRSAWRAIKERFDLCVENVQRDRFAMPYRLAYLPTDCGFVLASASSELSSDSNWVEMRTNAVVNFAIGHKYECKVTKCIGVLVSKDGPRIDIQWCMIDQPWEEDREVQRWLEEQNPFRPLTDGTKFGFYTLDKPT